MARKQRDTQRGRLYDAESSLDLGSRYPTVIDVQRYVDHVVASRWWRSHFPRCAAIGVKPGHGNRASSDRRGYISVPPAMRYQRYVLHEIAHQATDSLYGTTGVAGHGPEFARTLLAVYRRWLGAESGAQLADGYRTHRVRFRLVTTS